MDNYKELVENAKYYLDENLRTITNLSNLSAYLFQELDKLNWVGFYLYDYEEIYLVLFQ